MYLAISSAGGFDFSHSLKLRVLSFWLLLGLLPPALYELWLVWPQLTP